MPQDELLKIFIARTDEALRGLITARRVNLAVEVATRAAIDESRKLLAETAEMTKGYRPTKRQYGRKSFE